MLLMQKLHSCPQEVPCEYKASLGQGDLGSEIHFAGDPWGSGIPLCGLQPLSLTLGAGPVHTALTWMKFQHLYRLLLTLSQSGS